MEKNAVTRAEFIRRYMDDCGFSYVQACRAYETTIAVMEDAIVTASKINLGRLGALVPQWFEPRAVNMGFERTADNSVQPKQRTFFLGKRIRYKFHLYKKFQKTHQLRWFSDPPDEQPKLETETDT